MNQTPPQKQRADKRILLAVVSLLLSASLVFAAGQTEEDDFQQVDGTGNWEHTIDVSELEPGTYNILVRARDEAGNETMGGPYNIYVDPDSDLPQLAISYPQRMQRTGEDLFVVGSAWDDDAVGHVEVKINDGSFRRADGDRFWSLLVPLAALEDGPQTVTARAVDINGVTGPEYSVPFRLDRSGPRSEVSSHESGVLVTGRTRIEGTVEDENGVVSLSLVRPDGSERLNLRGREDEPRPFSFEIDPREMDEGPSVWWLESIDGTGTVGSVPFLFFVDTNPPELEVLYPSAEDRVDAQLRVAGRLSDTVGIDSLTYELGGETGEISLRPGDPFWTLAVDLPSDTRGNVTLTLEARDRAGNVDVQRVRFPIDSEGDQPVVTVSTPADGSVSGYPALTGHVNDDDGPAQVVYSLNDGAPVTIDATDGFSVPLVDAVPGSNNVSIYAVDRYGLTGETVRRRFTRATPLPVLSFETVTREESSEPYAPGFVLSANERATLSGSLTEPSGAFPSRVSYSVGGVVSTAQVGEGGSFSIGLPRSREASTPDIHVWFENEIGRISRVAGFYVQLPAGDDETPVPEPDELIGRGLHLALGDPPSGEDVPSIDEAPLTVSQQSPLLLAVAGGRVSDVALEPDVDFLSVRASGNTISVRATGVGFAPSVRVTGTVGGRSVRSEPFAVRTETDAPTVAVEGVDAGDHLAELPETVISVSDATAVSTVRAGFVPVGADANARLSAVTPVDGVYTFSAALPREQGPVLLRVEAVDEAGAIRVLDLPVIIDTTPPAATFVAPVSGELVNGTVSVIAIVENFGALASAGAGSQPQPASVPSDRMIVFPFSVSAEEPEVQFVLSDRGGNQAVLSSRLATDDGADRPQLTVQIPADGGVVVDDFRLSGVLLDDDEPVALEYSINGNDPIRIDASGPFDRPLDTSGLQDGVHTIEVVGFDLEDVASEPVSRSFIVSRTAPVVEMVSPSIESFQRQIIALTGTAEDPNGVDFVEVSVDSGASFQRARGAESWRYSIDTSLLDDGTHSVLVRATDAAGMSALLTTTINVDNTEPLLELALPSDGETVTNQFLIDGRAEDAAFEQIRLVLQPLDREASPIELAQFTTPGPFAYSVNTETLASGWYNLRVEASDRAGNARQISQNLRVEPADRVEVPKIVLPVDGAALAGDVTVVVRAPAGQSVPLYLNNRLTSTVDIDNEGRGTLVLESESLSEGEIDLSLEPIAEAPESAGNETDAPVPSVHTITWRNEGPWLMITAPAFDSYVRDRPFLSGTAGYALSLPSGDDRDARQERDRLLREHELERVEVSLDNGQTWVDARGTSEWRHRIETTVLPDGPIHYVVRALFANGESAVQRHTVVIDEQPPVVRLLAPAERDTFDETIRVVGATADENVLNDVSVVLRPGDKASYELPSFIQGLYIDLHALGATYFDVGAGLSFFDDNVRLQAQIGVSPPGRFSGLVLGTKLLANIASIPASFFFGPDFEWLGAAVALGANFSYFTMSEDSIEFTDQGLVLAGMVAQLEFPVITVRDLPLFNTYSLYTEYQLWFISSDVQAGTASRLAFGLRLNLF